jgi:hypothetical protein
MSKSATKLVICAAAASLLAGCAYPPVQPYGSMQAGCAPGSPAAAPAVQNSGNSAAFSASAPGPDAPCTPDGAYQAPAYAAEPEGAFYAPGFDSDLAGYGGLGTYNDFYGPDYGGAGYYGGGFYGGGVYGGGYRHRGPGRGGFGGGGFHGASRGGGGHGGGFGGGHGGGGHGGGGGGGHGR